MKEKKMTNKSDYRKLLEVIACFHGAATADLYDKIARGKIKVQIEEKEVK